MNISFSPFHTEGAEAAESEPIAENAEGRRLAEKNCHDWPALRAAALEERPRT
jgi:hypothetical protein